MSRTICLDSEFHFSPTISSNFMPIIDLKRINFLPGIILIIIFITPALFAQRIAQFILRLMNNFFSYFWFLKMHANKTTIERTIEQLLHRHECVILPDFGGFIVRDSPCNFNAAKDAIKPFAKNITSESAIDIHHLSSANFKTTGSFTKFPSSSIIGQ